MRTLRDLSALVSVSVGAFAAFASASSTACSNKADKSAETGGTAGKATGGTSMIALTGGSAGAGASAGMNAGGTSGSGLGGTGTAAAAGEEGIPECGQLPALGKCGGTSVEAELRTVNMLIVIDKSGSMDDKPEGFDQKKWPALKSALATALAKVKTRMNFGLIMYPYSITQSIPLDGCDTNCCSVEQGSAAVNVGIAPGAVSVDQINEQLALASPGGGTPTADALKSALAYFQDGDGAALKGEKYVLLATDGGPNCNKALTCDEDRCTTNLDGSCDNGNCCEDEDTTGLCLDDQAVLTRLGSLSALGISTFVVGIPGTEAYAPYLDTFAEAGGVPAVDADQKYYAVSANAGVEGLVDVFDTITTQLVRDCDIPLPEQPAKLENVNVAIDCDLVPLNTNPEISGWDFDQRPDPTSVVVHGPACDALRANGAKRVDVVFGCPSVR